MIIQNANAVDSVDENVVFSIISQLVTESISQVYKQTLERNICDKERYEVDNFVDTIETGMPHATSTEMNSLPIFRVGLAIRSAKVRSTRNFSCVPLSLKKFFRRYGWPTNDRFM